MRATDSLTLSAGLRAVPGNLLWTVFAWAALTWMLLLHPAPAAAVSLNSSATFSKFFPTPSSTSSSTSASTSFSSSPSSTCDPNTATCFATPTCPGWQQELGECSSGGSPHDGGSCAAPASGRPGCSGAGNPINLITGNKYQQEVDVPKLPGVLGLMLSREYNSLSTHVGVMGGGWHMSYETMLYDFGGQLQIVQPDGQRLMFRRGMGSGVVLCTSPQPEDGQVSVVADTPGHITYSWRWPDGRVLVFGTRAGSGGSSRGSSSGDANSGHLLQSITAPGGEQLSLNYSPQGELVQVRDPQSRTLNFIYDAHGVLRAIDTPVGRFEYTFDAKRRLVQVAHRTSPDTAPDRTRVYHYESRYNGGHEHALTGISVRSVDPATHRMVEQRLSTYAYGSDGLAILTTKGEPRRLKDGRPVEGTGIEQVDVAYLNKALPTEGRVDASGEVQPRQLGHTVLTNSLGQKTEVLSAIVAGHYRLVQMTGPGCSTCGPANMHYTYNAAGQRLRAIRLDGQGRALDAEVTEYDGHGRVVRIGLQADAGGKHPATRWWRRYEYTDIRAADGSVALAAQPSLIAEPSVVSGQEHVRRFTYTAIGQPERVVEEGFSPIDDHGLPMPAGMAITRTTIYRYTKIGSRTLLAEIDGPLAHMEHVAGSAGSVLGADVVRLSYDARGDFMTELDMPMGLRQRFRHDETTGRLMEEVDADGVVTRYGYAAGGEVATTERAGQRVVREFDALGRVVRVSDAPGRGITLQYDAGNRVVAVIDFQGYKAETTFDTEDGARRSALYEPGKALPLRATYRWFDDQRRLVRQLSPDGHLDTWRYGHGGQGGQGGQAVVHVDGEDVLHLDTRNAFTGTGAHIDLAPDGMVRASLALTRAVLVLRGLDNTRRDDFGRTVAAVLPGQGARTWTYDAGDRVREFRRFDRLTHLDETQRYTYDAAGRLTAHVTTDHAGRVIQTVTRRYEGTRLVEESDAAQTRRFTYDGAGRLDRTELAFKDDQGHVAWTTILRTRFDTTGEVAERVLADGSTMRLRHREDTHAAERITLRSPFWSRVSDRVLVWLPNALASRVRDWLPEQTVAADIVFHPYDGITGYRLGNGLKVRKAFDIAGRVTALMTAGKGSDLRDTADETLHYDGGPQVRAIERPGIVPAAYVYDGFGALHTPDSPRPMTASLVKTPTGELDEAEPAAARMDTLGRIVDDGRLRYTYTPDGQVETIKHPDGTLVARYRYDADGHRVGKTLASGETTWIVWQGDHLVAEVAGSGPYRGEVLTQYLYLGSEGRLLPIAKIDGAHAAGNATGTERLLFIHADYRGQPLAMTDANRHVVWRGRPDVWGYVSPDAAPQAAVLNLRLPGQYFDAETGLYDNGHRSYDPRPDSPMHGRYLSPDPLGFPNGPDAYVYGGGDPVNNTDAMGLYESDIHYYMTFVLALAAGADYDRARTIALADQNVDENPLTRPINPHAKYENVTDNAGAIRRLLSYHFTLDESQLDKNNDGLVSPQGYGSPPDSTDINDPLTQDALKGHNDQLQRLLDASSISKHSELSSNCAARDQLFGEFLHAFEDTFAHRDATNQVYAINKGFGHASGGNDPDFTYSKDPTYQGRDEIVEQRIWSVRPVRTERAELETYDQLKSYLGTGSTPRASFDSISSMLEQFNAIHESEEDGNTVPFSLKLQKLQALIDPWHVRDGSGTDVKLSDFDSGGFDKKLAETNRTQNLCSGTTWLNQMDYPGTILPSQCAAHFAQQAAP